MPLDRCAERPGEYLAEVILNLAKTLECLFPPTNGQLTADAARNGLKNFGYADDEIERDFIPVIYLRSSIDVAHVQLRTFTMSQLKTLYSYVERVESIFRGMVNLLLEKVKAGEFQIEPYDRPETSSAADRTIAKIAKNMPPEQDLKSVSL